MGGERTASAFFYARVATGNVLSGQAGVVRTSEPETRCFQRDVSRLWPLLAPLMLWSELLEVSVPGRAGWDTFS